ncbi:hypothetical protein QS460_08035 [Liquorilactobacillus mali]|nr:6-pyruvoyl-tetrahydropterin synthase-related protein [Liquorilactobacillus mali]MDN7145878.1 hypothetical protein [Liquorilactobacillus mali]
MFRYKLKDATYMQTILKITGIFISFCILSYLFVQPLLTKGMIFNGDDAWYQIDRIFEIKRNLAHGVFMPFMYTFTFGQIAFPLGIFYPQITISVISVITFFFKNAVTGVYAGIAFFTLITLIITYYTLRKLGKSSSSAYVGAILYAFATYRTVDAFSRFAMGEYLAMTFLPLCFYGLYAILSGKNKDWPYLAIGFSFILLSHVLTAFIIAIVLCIILIFNLILQDDRIRKFQYLMTAGVATICSSAIFLFPFIEQRLFQAYNIPTPTNLAKNAQTFSGMVTSALENSVQKNLVASYSVGLTSIIIIILGAIFFKNLKSFEKLSYIIATVVFIFSSALFPWSLLQSTPVMVIQYTFRLLAIPTLLYAVVGAGLFDLFLNSYDKISRRNFVVFIMVLIGILSCWYSSMQKLATESQYVAAPAMTNDGNISNGTMYTDQYTPKHATKFLNDFIKHVAIIDNKKVTLKKIKPSANQLAFTDKKVKNAEKIDLPVAYYKNYVAYRNGKRIQVKKSTRGSMLVESKGKGAITIRYKYSVIDFLGAILSVLTWVGFVVWFVRAKIRKNVID